MLALWVALGLACPTVTEVTVRGDSLAGVVEPGQTLVMHGGGCVDIVRGDVVAFDHPRRSIWTIKQVRAVAGDAVTLDPLAVNGVVLQSRSGPYLLSKGQRAMLDASLTEGRVPEGRFLVLGTDPRGGWDSTRMGLISREAIRARMHAVAPQPR